MKTTTRYYYLGGLAAIALLGTPAFLDLQNLKKDRANFPVNMKSLTREGPDYYLAVIDYGNGNIVTNYLGKVENSNLVGKVEDGQGV